MRRRSYFAVASRATLWGRLAPLRFVLRGSDRVRRDGLIDNVEELLAVRDAIGARVVLFEVVLRDLRNRCRFRESEDCLQLAFSSRRRSSFEFAIGGSAASLPIPEGTS